MILKTLLYIPEGFLLGQLLYNMNLSFTEHSFATQECDNGYNFPMLWRTYHFTTINYIYIAYYTIWAVPMVYYCAMLFTRPIDHRNFVMFSFFFLDVFVTYFAFRLFYCLEGVIDYQYYALILLFIAALYLKKVKEISMILSMSLLSFLVIIAIGPQTSEDSLSTTDKTNTYILNFIIEHYGSLLFMAFVTMMGRILLFEARDFIDYSLVFALGLSGCVLALCCDNEANIGKIPCHNRLNTSTTMIYTLQIAGTYS
jgi:hypothetical protein